MHLLTRFQSYLEVRRLEKMYTTRKTTPPSAYYVDGEYIHQSPAPSPARHKSSQPYTSSSSTFAATQQHTCPTSSLSFTSPTSSSSFTSPVLSVPTRTTTTPKSHTNNGGGSSNIKHSSWHSLTTSSIHGSGSGTTLASSAESTSPPNAISRNSRGQTWEPPKQGWGGDGTDAFKVDKKEFRFDVEKDRRSVERED